MKILVMGAGVIGITYAWKLSEAGNQVTVLVREGKKRVLDSEGFHIGCIDQRKKQKTPEEIVFRPTLVEELSSQAKYDLIIVAVRSHQVDAILPLLDQGAGDADVLFFQHNWWGDDHIKKCLSESQYLFGFSRLVGGWRDEDHVQCTIFDSPMMATMLGEKSGEITPRLQMLADVFLQAGLKPELSQDILGWLATHYVEFLGAVGAVLKVGSTKQFVANAELVKDALLATREGLDVCRARGINLARSAPFNLRLYDLPLSLIMPLARWQYRMPSIQQFLDENVRHGLEEISSQYFDVVNEGERLGVYMPHLEAFREVYMAHKPIIHEYA